MRTLKPLSEKPSNSRIESYKFSDQQWEDLLVNISLDAQARPSLEQAIGDYLFWKEWRKSRPFPFRSLEHAHQLLSHLRAALTIIDKMGEDIWELVLPEKSLSTNMGAERTFREQVNILDGMVRRIDQAKGAFKLINSGTNPELYILLETIENIANQHTLVPLPAITCSRAHGSVLPIVESIFVILGIEMTTRKLSRLIDEFKHNQL